MAHVESLSHDGRGVAHVNGKATFIDGALPGEEVLFTYITQRKRFDEGRVATIILPAADRSEPRCKHFGVCGGCSLQHLSVEAQILAKQQVLLDSLKHIGKLEPETLLPPLSGPAWGYRRRARLGVKFVIKKDKLLIGFREKRSSLLADLECCEVLHPSIGTLLPKLRQLVMSLACHDRIPQIEVAVGDDAAALVFRNLVALDENDLDALRRFGQGHHFQIYLQPAGPQSITLVWPEAAILSYRLPDYNVELFFSPTDFTQVNADINLRMVARVMEILDPQAHERVLDLFCGLGNFTLPLARCAGHVVGLEGDARLVQRACDNATHNRIANAEFHGADLAEDFSGAEWGKQRYDKILLDPPRTGALEIVRQLPALGASRIVYVSCNPATLARDAHELVHHHGHRLVSAGVMDMFPHTTHVESVALFEPAS